MSRKGNCLDNSPAEGFFARLKTELNLSKGKRSGQASLQRIITEYIHWWNINESSPGYTPAHYVTDNSTN